MLNVPISVDPVCINQHDDAEKSTCVDKMKDIYKNAASVFAWLGPAADNSDVAMDFIQEVGNASIDAGMLDNSREIMQTLWDPNPSDQLASIREPIKALSKKLDLEFPQQAVKDITERSYWTRTWIIQEFSLASDIVIACGSKRLRYPQLRAGINFLSMHNALVITSASAKDREDPVRGPALRNFIKIANSGTPATSSLIGSRKRYQELNKDRVPTLLELLTQFSNRMKVTDARDRIYAVLGMAKDEMELGIKVNYGLKVNEIYTETARALLQQSYTDVLSWCASNRRPGLPSWVPDFDGTLREPYGSYKSKNQPWEPLFNASKTQKVKIMQQSSPDNPDSITIAGVTLDSLKELGIPWQESEGEDFWQPTRTFLHQIMKFMEQARQLPQQISKDESFWNQAFLRIPCADQAYHGFNRRRADGTAEDGLLEVIARMNYDRSGYKDTARDAAFKKYDGAMGYLYGLRPFLSETGYIGLAPEYAEPGDVLCVIIGAIVPYALRRVPGHDGSFTLVGEAYVHGIMDGEAIDLGLKEEPLCLM